MARKILQSVSGAQGLTVSKCGTETLAEAGDVFTGYVDSDFRNWGLNEPSAPTPPTKVNVYEMAEDATFAQMFGSLSSDTAKLCLTQAQIKRFVKEHRKHLRSDGYATFFLFKVGDNFFVADVYLNAGEPVVYVRRFELDVEWDGDYRRRVVVPQLCR